MIASPKNMIYNTNGYFITFQKQFQQGISKINPSPVSPSGEKLFAPITNIDLEIQQTHHIEKQTTKCPPPLGYVPVRVTGQTDTPIRESSLC
jgi:hypothetical protein